MRERHRARREWSRRDDACRLPRDGTCRRSFLGGKAIDVAREHHDVPCGCSLRLQDFFHDAARPALPTHPRKPRNNADNSSRVRCEAGSLVAMGWLLCGLAKARLLILHSQRMHPSKFPASLGPHLNGDVCSSTLTVDLPFEVSKAVRRERPCVADRYAQDPAGSSMFRLGPHQVRHYAHRIGRLPIQGGTPAPLANSSGLLSYISAAPDQKLMLKLGHAGAPHILCAEQVQPVSRKLLHESRVEPPQRRNSHICDTLPESIRMKVGIKSYRKPKEQARPPLPAYETKASAE